MTTLEKTQQAMSLEQMRRRPHWSYSRINGLVSHCSLQWAFRYVYNVEPEFTSSALVFGTAWHRTLELVYSRRMEGRETGRENAAAFFSDQFGLEVTEARPRVRFTQNEDFDTLAEKGREMVGVMLSDIDENEKVSGVSVPFSVPIIDADGTPLDTPLVGEFDCVLEKNDQPIIVDWKTAAKKWTDQKVKSDLQSTCYLYAWHHMHPDTNPGFRFDVVTKTKNPAYITYSAERDGDDFMRLGETVRVLERMIQAEAFFPDEQGMDCGNCPYTQECRRWHREYVYRKVFLKEAA